MQTKRVDPETIAQARPATPMAMADLSSGAYLGASSLRQWVRSNHMGRCAGCDLYPPHHDYSCAEAIPYLHQLMLLLAKNGRRSIEIRHLDHPELSYDELTLLRLIALAGHGRRPRYVGRLARGLVHDNAAERLCLHAHGYRAKLEESGLTVAGWPEMELVQ